LTLPSFTQTFPQTADGFNGQQAAVLQSFLVASCARLAAVPDAELILADLIGCFFGALVNLWLGDKLGRKKTIVW
jgi:hypothetical protein